MAARRLSLAGPRLVANLCDIPLLYGLFLGAYHLRFDSGLFPKALAPPPLAQYRPTFALLAIGWVLILWGYGFYEEEKFGVKQAFRLGGHLFTAGGFTLALFFFRRDFSYSRLWILLGFGLAFVGLSVFHWAKARGFAFLRARGIGRSRGVVVGPRVRALTLLEHFEKDEAERVRFLGSIDLPSSPDSDPGARPTIRARLGDSEIVKPAVAGARGVPVRANQEALAEKFPSLGPVQELVEIVEREDIHEIFVTDEGMAPLELGALLETCERTAAQVRYVPGTFAIFAHGVEMRLVAGLPVVDLGRQPMLGVDGFAKRILDVLGAGMGLVLLAPILALLAWLVRRDSPGPILYRQVRVGLDGKPFEILKFRSMPVDAEAQTGPVWSKPGDGRATPLGAFMRKWSLDELPQLWNVFKGEMSLVGPRPERPHFVEQFRENIPGYMQRHKVKAGITGWAQINGLRGECPIEDRTLYDIWYIENWSILLDFEILLRTIGVVLFRPDGH